MCVAIFHKALITNEIMRLKYLKLSRTCHYLFILFLSLFMTLGIACLIPTQWHYSQNQNCEVSIYVINSGVHTDIIVSLQNQIFDWKKYFNLDKIGTDFNQNYQYLSFGWGDENFYVHTPSIRNLNIIRVLKALFFPNNSSVIRLQGYERLPKTQNIKTVRISSDNYLKLTNYILSSFQKDQNQQIIRIANGYASHDGFYAAHGNYSIMRTCNQWTADALRVADINTPLWGGFSSVIMWHLRSNC